MDAQTTRNAGIPVLFPQNNSLLIYVAVDGAGIRESNLSFCLTPLFYLVSIFGPVFRIL